MTTHLDDPDTRRFFVSLGFPEMVFKIITIGDDHSPAADECRGRLNDIALACWKEVKEEFGCDDQTYLPYSPCLPEYDPEITSRMQEALCAKIESAPQALDLVKAVGGTWPVSGGQWHNDPLSEIITYLGHQTKSSRISKITWMNAPEYSAPKKEAIYPI